MATTPLHVQDVITIYVTTISSFNFNNTKADCTFFYLFTVHLSKQHVPSAE
jgi:hypothetical protein